jgi:hypothetical protein
VQSSLLKLVAFLGVAWVLASCEKITAAPKIDRVVDDADGFDLVLEDSAGRAPFGLFEVGYAIKANYAYFTYRRMRYSSVGGGSVLIQPVSYSPAQYEVRETVISVADNGTVNASLLQVIEKRTGVELARRKLVAHAVEDGTGWTGDHALNFIRSVLKSSQPPGHAWWGGPQYPIAVADVKVMPSQDASPFPVNFGASTCGQTLGIERRPSNATLRGSSFEFLPRAPLQFAICGSEHVLVASGVYASDLHLDLLNTRGDHIAQGYVRLPLPLEARWASMSRLSVDGANVEATVLANRGSGNSLAPYARVQVKATLKCHRSDCTAESVR